MIQTNVNSTSTDRLVRSFTTSHVTEDSPDLRISLLMKTPTFHTSLYSDWSINGSTKCLAEKFFNSNCI